jgi:hypothetical protein
MATPSLPIKNTNAWKRVALISFFSGLGIAMAAAIVLASFIWYKARPTPPKPWNTSALVVTEPPSFDVSKDGKSLELGYAVKNNMPTDYSLDDATVKTLRVMTRFRDGRLGPLNNFLKFSDTPIFMPAGQTVTVDVSIDLPDLPTRKGAEKSDDYHERLRTYLETEYPGVSAIVLYEEVNRYQINLPKWADKKSTN